MIEDLASKERDTKLLLLKNSDANWILLIYFAIIVCGIYVSVYNLIDYSTTTHKEQTALAAGLAMSAVGGSVFYTRKLYQACINSTYTFVSVSNSELSSKDRFRRKGSLAFFLMRPVFGVAFSVVVYAFWRLSIAASDESPLTPSAGFLYTTITLGFLSGFSAGKMLTLLEGYGASRLGPMLGKDA